MANSIRRIKQRTKAEATLNLIMEAPEMVNVIHYSCESFYDREDGTSPRVTSIAVQNLSNGQIYSFSIHQFAEIEGLSPEHIEDRYDEFEKTMLEEFYAFIKQHEKHKWLHWNMRDRNYGFLALEHRCKVLNGNPVKISESNIFDLSRILVDIYGAKYSEHPRLERLMEKNRITRKDFLSGKEEANAFEKKQYVKLHQSTLRKVDILSSIANRAWQQELITNATWKDMYGSKLIALVDSVMNHWLFKIISIIGLIAGIIFGVVPLLQK